jgi:hypothetical protein
LPHTGAIIPGKIEVKNDAGRWEEVSVATMMKRAANLLEPDSGVADRHACDASILMNT